MQREQAATQALEQYQTIMPATSEYLSNRELFEQWKNHQAQPQAQAPQAPQAPAEPESWWNPPKVEEQYKQFMLRDANGQEAISEHAPLMARQQLQAYQAHRANFARQFLENPQTALAPMIENIVAERAGSIASTQISALQEKEFVSRVEQENSDWLYDQQGNAAPAGLLVQKYIEDAKRLGIQGAENRWNYAKNLVERDALQRAYEANAPEAEAAPTEPPPVEAPKAETQAEQNMEYLRRQAQRKPAARATANKTDARTPQRATTFADRFRATLKEEGLSPS